MGGDPAKIFVQIVFGEFAESEKIGFTLSGKASGGEPEFNLTLLEAAYRVLREAKRPLSCQEIVNRAARKKLHRSSGATPQNSLNAVLARDIKANGEKSRFAKVGRGLFIAR